MHPIERLRYVARASGVDAGLLAREVAGALSGFTDDPAGLVTACRRIIERHPASGPLWWLCSRVLLAADPRAEVWAAAEELALDGTPEALLCALPEDRTVTVLGWPEQVGEALLARPDLEVLVLDAAGEARGLVAGLTRAEVDAAEVPIDGTGEAVAASDLVLLEASCVGPRGFVAVSGSHAAAAVARHAEVPVWLVAGVGRLLPERVWNSVEARLDARGAPWDRDEEVCPLDLVDRVVGPTGPQTVEESLRRTDCPIAPELLHGV